MGCLQLHPLPSLRAEGTLGLILSCLNYSETFPAHKPDPDLGGTGQTPAQRTALEGDTDLSPAPAPGWSLQALPQPEPQLPAQPCAPQPRQDTSGKMSQPRKAPGQHLGIFVDPEGKIILGCLGGNRQSVPVASEQVTPESVRSGSEGIQSREYAAKFSQ